MNDLTIAAIVILLAAVALRTRAVQVQLALMLISMSSICGDLADRILANMRGA